MLEEMHDGQKYDKKGNFGQIESTPMILLPKLLCSMFFFFQKTKTSMQTLEKLIDIALFSFYLLELYEMVILYV